MKRDRSQRHKPHRSLTRSLLVMVAGSFAFGFALVPLYNVFCEAAGIRVNATPSQLQASESAGRTRMSRSSSSRCCRRAASLN